MFRIQTLWEAPEVNPISKKARSVPVLNPFNMYGRVFFFSWLGFMVAFWAWYTFPPLLTVTITKDLGLTPAEVANSNVVSLTATLGLRVLVGPLCDQFGSRKVYASLLLIGCLPIGLSPLVQNAAGLYVARFFIGVLGATFVPCQVWCTAFFDKNIVGTANALAGGWGNAGGGLTYLVMPAVFDSLVAGGMSGSKAWRVTFVVPLICLIACAVGMLLLTDDTPNGDWNTQDAAIRNNMVTHGLNANGDIVDVPGDVVDKGSDIEKVPGKDNEIDKFDHEADIDRREAHEIGTYEVVRKPTFKEAIAVSTSLQTAFHVVTYACSFGGELAINSILSKYYIHNYPELGQTTASNYASIFAFLNFVTRPLGGVIADVLYNSTNRNLWSKKLWITTCGVMTGALLLVIGLLDIKNNVSGMVGLVAVMAFFHEAGNGANFALVPHVHPHANGIISGLTGAGGNLGGVIFALMFRFVPKPGDNFAQVIWIMGIIMIGLNLSLVWVKPLPKGQVGGR